MKIDGSTALIIGAVPALSLLRRPAPATATT